MKSRGRKGKDVRVKRGSAAAGSVGRSVLFSIWNKYVVTAALLPSTQLAEAELSAEVLLEPGLSSAQWSSMAYSVLCWSQQKARNAGQLPCINIMTMVNCQLALRPLHGQQQSIKKRLLGIRPTRLQRSSIE